MFAESLDPTRYSLASGQCRFRGFSWLNQSSEAVDASKQLGLGHRHACSGGKGKWHRRYFRVSAPGQFAANSAPPREERDLCRGGAIANRISRVCNPSSRFRDRGKASTLFPKTIAATLAARGAPWQLLSSAALICLHAFLCPPKPRAITAGSENQIRRRTRADSRAPVGSQCCARMPLCHVCRSPRVHCREPADHSSRAA